MQDKVVIITGASSGIGLALARHFGRRGSRLVLAARNQAALDALAAELRKAGTEATVVVADVRQRADCARIIDTTLANYGRIDVLINNAGITMRALLHQAPPEAIAQVMDVNFWGALHCTQLALPHLLASRGSVVGVSSIGGYRGLPGRTAYSASKFALNALLEVLRTEHLYDGLHVLTAAPYFTTSNIRKHALGTDGQPVGESFRDEQRMMSAERCAEIIYQAVLRRRRAVVMTPMGRLTVWLNKLWPSLADRVIYGFFKKEQGNSLS